MSLSRSVEEVGRNLRSAENFTAVFGILPEGTVAERKSALRKQFAYLAGVVHPDHVPSEDKEEAAEIFRLLSQMRHSAEAAIEANTYGKPFARGAAAAPDSVSESGAEMQSPSGSYRLAKAPFRFGDFSVLYQGKILGGSEKEVLVKISSEPRHNNWLEREGLILERFGTAAAGTPLSGIAPFVPKLLDTFLASGKNGKRFRVMVAPYIPGLVSVADIIAAFPRGLDPRDAAWIWRRVLAQTIAAEMAGVVHGAIVPDHVLVHPLRHEPLHIGWAHAIETGAAVSGRITHIIDRWRDWYPPEVFAREPVDCTADLFMAAKTMMKLLGGDPQKNKLPPSHPEKMTRLILRCVDDSPARRPQNGKQVLDEYTRLVKDQWGRVYRPLVMPVC